MQMQMARYTALLALALLFLLSCCSDASSNHGTPSKQGTSSSGGGGGISRRLVLKDGTSRSLSFRAKSGIKKGLPTLGLNFGSKSTPPQPLDARQRRLHVTPDSLLLEIEGDDTLLQLSQGADSASPIAVKAVAYSHQLVEGEATSIPIDGVYGFFDLPSGPHVAVITKSRVRFSDSARALEFRQVGRVLLVPLSGGGGGDARHVAQLSEAQEREEARRIELLRLAFASHQLYFSHVHDVTQSLQRRAAAAKGRKTVLWRGADERFFWNREVLAPLLAACDAGGDRAAAAAAEKWVTPVMSAFLQAEEGCCVGDHRFSMLFVSRRSCRRQGMRYTRRGIDSEGNVANFVETEQALLHEGGEITAHVQVRGSIPLFWSSPVNLRYHPPVRLGEDDAANVAALRRHALQLARDYGSAPRSLVFVNLVDKGKDQGMLGEAFERALQQLRASGGGGGDAGWPHPPDALQHVWFDFHSECRGEGGWANLDKLMAEVDAAVGEHGFLVIGRNGRVAQRQRGVVRTNCMDCLDRTNVVQSLLARRSLLAQLRAVGADVPPPEAVRDSTLLAVTSGETETADADGDGSALDMGLGLELEKRFRDVWGNNADEIAVLYAGTPALKGDFTRTGKRTKRGAVKDGANSVMRYIVNNFQDHRRQEAVDFLLHGHAPRGAGNGRSAAAAAWDDIRSSVDLDLWTRLSLPNARSPALKGTLYVGVRRKKPARSGGGGATAAALAGAMTDDGGDEGGGDGSGGAARAALPGDSSDWLSDEDMDGDAEFIVGGVDLPRLGMAVTGGSGGGGGAGGEYARFGMAGLALLALCGEMGPRQLAALLGGLMIVPLVQLLQG